MLIATTTSAFSADLKSGNPPAPKFSQLPVATWSGFYAGANLGYGTNNTKESGANSFSKQRGALVGVTLGYNHQFSNNMVLGVEGDYAWSGIQKKKTETRVVFRGREESETAIKTTSFGTLRGRLGYSFGSFMPYVTGGMAIITSKVNGKDTFYPTGGGSFSDTVSASATKVGYALGVGAEAMITNNISLKAEYIHAGFSKSDYDFKTSGGGTGTVKLSNSVHVGRVGLNYRF